MMVDDYLSKLTNGAVHTIMSGTMEVKSPVFQVLGFKKIAGQGGNDRYRLNISDGVKSHTFAMLATQLNAMIPEGRIDNNCIIRVDKFVANIVSGKRVLILLEVVVLAKGTEVKIKLGSPTQWLEGAAADQKPPVSRPKETDSLVKVEQSPRGQASASFYGTKQTGTAVNGNAKPAALPSFPSGGTAIINVVPIRDINPYNNKCSIKARITNKPPVRTWSNARGEGKLFSMDLLDDSGEIRMTGFNQSVDQYYDILETNKVYYISRFSVKPVNRAFNSLSHEFEISFQNDTTVSPCTEDTSDIPTITFNFVDIANISAVNNNTVIDVIGICSRKGECQTLMSRNLGKELKKRDLTLVDRTNHEITLTLWGKQAEEFEDDSQPVIAVKGAKVSEYNGRSLSTIGATVMHTNPDIKESHLLRGWFDNGGNAQEVQSLSVARTAGGGGTEWKLLQEANTQESVNPEKGDYFMSKVTVVAIKRDAAMYKACALPNCNKKVIDSNNGMYRCEKCNQEINEFKWRYMLQINFADSTDFIWATAFNEHSEQILGKTPEEGGDLFQSDPDGFDTMIKEAVFRSFVVKFRTRMETYNGESRRKANVVDLHPVNFKEYGRKLLAEIRECSA